MPCAAIKRRADSSRALAYFDAKWCVKSFCEFNDQSDGHGDALLKIFKDLSEHSLTIDTFWRDVYFFTTVGSYGIVERY
jgi:hypothetical protein